MPALTEVNHPLIEDYALIGDLHTAALVSRHGSVDWLCLPRFDSDAVFAALLGDVSNGRWLLSPAETGTAETGTAETGTAERAYRGDTLILTTRWRTGTGTVLVTDFMPPRGDAAPAVVRIVEGIDGSVDMTCAISLRFGYGKIVPWVRRIDDSIHAVAGPDAVWIDTPVRLAGHDRSHHASFTVRAGERVPFVLTWQPSHASARPPAVDPDQALDHTEAFWAQWAARCRFDGPHADAVIRSLITVKALTYPPTGGIVAAPTTSLPEDIGGVRNWDYRYCWLRDATMVLEALLRSGHTQEATAWRDWLGRAIAGTAKDVQIMYGVAGERRLAEWTADWLPGYLGSAPVRIGNGAVDQRQLDVYGEVIDALMLGGRAGLTFDQHTVALIDGLIEFVEQHWDEPDTGIWEVRGPRRHFVYSKVMAWVAFDRRIKLAEAGQADCGEADVRRWRESRTAIHAQVCEQGYSRSAGAFTQYYGSQELDAAALMIGEVGFLPPHDERIISTVHAIKRELMKDGLVMRYAAAGHGDHPVDGLPGSEGAFLACSFWLVSALLQIGEHDEASALFDRLLALRNDVGLLSEEYDTRYDRQVGNFPQAFSHVPLIQAAFNLADHAREHSRVP